MKAICAWRRCFEESIIHFGGWECEEGFFGGAGDYHSFSSSYDTPPGQLQTLRHTLALL